jgi:exosome complex component RRP42
MGEQVRMPYKITKKNVQEAMNKAERLDGRKPFEHRKIEVKFNISMNAESSVKVKFGKSEVVAGIKMTTAVPYPDHEKEGTLSTGMDLLPLSSPLFEYGAPTIEAVEIARVVDRGIRESRFIDFEKLCIKEGEKVWGINVDIATLNEDGNLIDAASLAAVLALLTARMPEYDEATGKINSGVFTDKGLPLKLENMPLTTTFFKVGDKIFIDPTREEEEATDGRLTFEVSSSGKDEMINAMQKGGDVTFDVGEVEMMAEEAIKIFKKLNSVVQEEIKGYEKEAKKKK